MSTTTPIRELILQDVVTVLKTIKTSNSFRTQVEDRNIDRLLRSPDEMNSSDFPALFVTDGPEDISQKTSGEVLSIFTIRVTGYVRYNKNSKTDNIPSVKLNKLIADVKEALNDTTTVLWTNNDIGVKLTAVATDEGFLAPDGAFDILADIDNEYAHNNAGSIVQS